MAAGLGQLARAWAGHATELGAQQAVIALGDQPFISPRRGVRSPPPTPARRGHLRRRAPPVTAGGALAAAPGGRRRGQGGDAPSTISSLRCRAPDQPLTSTPWRTCADGRTTRQRVHRQPSDRRGLGGDHRRRRSRACPAPSSRRSRATSIGVVKVKLGSITPSFKGQATFIAAMTRAPRRAQGRGATPAGRATPPPNHRPGGGLSPRAPAASSPPICTSPAGSPSSAAGSSATSRRS